MNSSVNTFSFPLQYAITASLFNTDFFFDIQCSTLLIITKRILIWTACRQPLVRESDGFLIWRKNMRSFIYRYSFSLLILRLNLRMFYGNKIIPYSICICYIETLQIRRITYPDRIIRNSNKFFFGIIISRSIQKKATTLMRQ